MIKASTQRSVRHAAQTLASVLVTMGWVEPGEEASLVDVLTLLAELLTIIVVSVGWGEIDERRKAKKETHQE